MNKEIGISANKSALITNVLIILLNYHFKKFLQKIKMRF